LLANCDDPPPLISDTIPADGSVITTAWPVISATLSDPEPGSGVQPLSTTLIIDSQVVTPQVNTAGGFAYTPTVRLTEGVHTVTAQVYDQAGNQTQSGPWSFTVSRGTAPSLGVTKYYMLGSQRIAMRQGDVVYFIHSDHLGSTSLTTDITGTLVAETRYLPYGEERWITGTLVTDFTFTGQRAERGFGLLDYNARYYDPGLGRFVSADTVVPEYTNPQALNRYAYTYNNPVRHIDPSGHLVPPLNCWVCGVQIDISGWPGLAKRLASVVGSATDFHVDLEQGLITGPTEQEAFESSLTNMVNPIGMVTGPARRGLSKVGKGAAEEVTEEIAVRAGRESLENLPVQTHHLLTNKSISKWTPIFEEIVDKYKLDLDDAWNKVEIPHRGRHPKEYHEWVSRQLREIDKIAQGVREDFLELFEERITKPVSEQPEMLTKEWWQ
jgi:RHS repeat-associated protein